ncbi:MAG: hypothetical protein ACKVP7_04240 [Hyphomicrobiaceae bacterium]
MQPRSATANDVNDLLAGHCPSSALHLQCNSRGSVELLIRPCDREGSPITPYSFVKLAEAIGAGCEVDLWVADRAKPIVSALRSDGFAGSVAINLSQSTLLAPQRLLDVLREPMQLEITEDTRVDGSNAELRLKQFAIEALQAGHTLSLDDLIGAHQGVERWELLRDAVVEIKIDLGSSRDLEGKPEAQGETWLKSLSAAELDAVSQAIAGSLNIVIERGGTPLSDRIAAILVARGAHAERIARQDFDIHRPEPLHAFVDRVRRDGMPSCASR